MSGPPRLQLTTLRRLPLDGNPLRALRNELAVGPTPKLLQWLRDKIPDNAGAVGQREAGCESQPSSPALVAAAPDPAFALNLLQTRGAVGQRLW